MDILLLGSGGREDALAWRLRQSPSCGRLIAAPGNPGIARWAECVAADPCDPAGSRRRWRGATPSTSSSSDRKRRWSPEWRMRCATAGIAVFGPNAAAAQLEGSKGFTKDLCRANGIPTADYVRVDRAADALAALDRFGIPVVIKADGLAAGKGVTVATSRAEARGGDPRRGRRAAGRSRNSCTARKRACSRWSTARPRCRSPRPRTTSASAKAIPAPTPAAWAPMRPRRC